MGIANHEKLAVWQPCISAGHPEARLHDDQEVPLHGLAHLGHYPPGWAPGQGTEAAEGLVL